MKKLFTLTMLLVPLVGFTVGCTEGTDDAAPTTPATAPEGGEPAATDDATGDAAATDSSADAPAGETSTDSSAPE